MRWQPEFWLRHRAVKTSHAETRPRNAGHANTLHMLQPGVTPGVEFEVRNFQLYGGLRRTRTEVKNTLPTDLTIKTEKTLLSFEEQKKTCPDAVNYGDLYRCLSASVVPTTASGKFKDAAQQRRIQTCQGPTTAGLSHDEQPTK